MKRPSSQRNTSDCLKRVCALLGVAAIIVGAGWSATGQQGGRTVRLPQVSELPSSAKRFAIVIGVDAYEDQQITGLHGAGNDASALASALVDYAGFPRDQVFLLTGASGERPTRPNILRRLANLKGVIPKDGLLLVAFSGHGIDRGGRGYLLPADAQSLGNVALLEETAVSVERIREFILETGAGQVLFIIDACRNDPTASKGDSDNAMSAAFSRGFSFDVANREVQAFATLYATEVGHRAYENRARGRGYFSEALVEGLSGKAANARGEVTLGALVTYLETTVPRRIALDQGAGAKQRPSARIELYRAAELIVSKVAPAVVPLTVDPAAVEMELWTEIKESQDATDFDDYLKQYPTGPHAGVAKAKIKRLRPAAAPIRQPEANGSELESLKPTTKEDTSGAHTATPDPAVATRAPVGGGKAEPAATRSTVQGGARSFELGGGASIEMVLIEAGTFTMGSTTGASDLRPIHRVTISKPYYVGKYEVTQAQWSAVVGNAPSTFKGPTLPVETVSWDDVQEFLRALNAQTDGGWRLPTEAEWEYACRSGTAGDYSGELDELGWYASTSGGASHPVGQKRPNGWGLFDMHGNVAEWCQDGYSDYTQDDQMDPAGAVQSSIRVNRGGGWYDEATHCSSVFRNVCAPGDRFTGLGFRLVRHADGLDTDSVPTLRPVPTDGGAEVTALATKPRKDVVVDLGKGVSLEMVLVPAGTFRMGATGGSADEMPLHRVTISKPFLMGKVEVTQAQWASLMGTNPAKFPGSDEHPVERVSWNECQQFIRRLNEKSGMTFRLPSEAEWEYACRAGTTGDYAGDLDKMAWYSKNSNSRTHEVGQRLPNAWGLYDMHGNVWEWCSDLFGSYTREDTTDPTGAAGGSTRVYRGGSWYNDAANCRSAKRYGTTPDSSIVNLGFRLAVTWKEDVAPIDNGSALSGGETVVDLVGSEGGLGSRARVLNSPRPEYTALARQKGTQGNVVVQVVLGANGRVLSVKVLKGLPHGLNEKAVDAAYKLKFKPATNEAGQPVDSTLTVSVAFVIR